MLKCAYYYDIISERKNVDLGGFTVERFVSDCELKPLNITGIR